MKTLACHRSTLVKDMSKKQKTGEVGSSSQRVIDAARLKIKDPVSVLAKVKLLTDKLRAQVDVEK